VCRLFSRVIPIPTFSFASGCFNNAYCSVIKHNSVWVELTVHEIPTCGQSIILRKPLKASSNIDECLVWSDCLSVGCTICCGTKCNCQLLSALPDEWIAVLMEDAFTETKSKIFFGHDAVSPCFGRQVKDYWNQRYETSR
jgi:hypothetical protein